MVCASWSLDSLNVFGDSRWAMTFLPSQLRRMVSGLVPRRKGNVGAVRVEGFHPNRSRLERDRLGCDKAWRGVLSSRLRHRVLRAQPRERIRRRRIARPSPNRVSSPCREPRGGSRRSRVSRKCRKVSSPPLFRPGSSDRREQETRVEAMQAVAVRSRSFRIPIGVEFGEIV